MKEAFKCYGIALVLIFQVGLLGLQMLWTRDSEMALTKSKSEKKVALLTILTLIEAIFSIKSQFSRCDPYWREFSIRRSLLSKSREKSVRLHYQDTAQNL